MGQDRLRDQLKGFSYLKVFYCLISLSALNIGTMLTLTKKLVVVAFTTALLLAAGELFARYALGLGTPPLSLQDSQIEYMFKPNQDVYRFGNRFVTNAYGMRSGAFTANREGKELRIMVFGDSVINGGNVLDQEDLATSIVQKTLAERMNRRVVTGNISAGSWGPGNWLGYARKFGFFDADIVVLVVSSHDYADAPTFTSLNRYHHPTKAPISALAEALDRYGIRFLLRIAGYETVPQAKHIAVPTSDQISQSMKDLRTFLDLAKLSADNLLVFQHWERNEVIDEVATTGNAQIRQLVESMGLTATQLYPYFKQSLRDAQHPFNDRIHPSQRGHQLIAKAILDNLPDSAL